jgi:hypothetical protein
MGFFSKIAHFFLPPPQVARYQNFQVKCNRCGEILSGRLDIFNDPSLDVEEGKTIYFCRKVLIGSGHCHQQVETTFKFDERHHVIEKQASGGVFIVTWQKSVIK